MMLKISITFASTKYVSQTRFITIDGSHNKKGLFLKE